VELDEVPYTNPVLRQSWSLIGQPLTVHIGNDYRTVRAFRADGTEFGALSVTGRWAKSPHTRPNRKEINRLERADVLSRRTDNPVASYNDWLAMEALKKKKGKRLKITKEATQLAASMHDSGGTAGGVGFVYTPKSSSSRRTFIPPRPRPKPGDEQ
jgi:hypothetical protein